MHNVIYVQCRMWGCGMTVFPLSALLRLIIIPPSEKIFHESTCRYGRSSPRTGWPGSTSGHESPAVCMMPPGTSTRWWYNNDSMLWTCITRQVLTKELILRFDLPHYTHSKSVKVIWWVHYNSSLYIIALHQLKWCNSGAIKVINATLALTVNCHKDRWKSMLQMYLHKDLFVTRPNAAPVWRSGRARAGCAPRTPTAGSSGTAGAARTER